MRYTDIAIIGGGLAGSTAAAMLGRAGVAAIMIDPHPVYPPDFRVEKLGGDEQIERLRKTGLADACCARRPTTARTGSRDSATCSTRTPSQQFGIMYDTLVNTIRAQIPVDIETIVAKAISISTSPERQKTRAVERRGRFRRGWSCSPTD